MFFDEFWYEVTSTLERGNWVLFTAITDIHAEETRAKSYLRITYYLSCQDKRIK